MFPMGITDNKLQGNIIFSPVQNENYRVKGNRKELEKNMGCTCTQMSVQLNTKVSVQYHTELQNSHHVLWHSQCSRQIRNASEHITACKSAGDMPTFLAVSQFYDTVEIQVTDTMGTSFFVDNWRYPLFILFAASSMYCIQQACRKKLDQSGQGVWSRGVAVGIATAHSCHSTMLLYPGTPAYISCTMKCKYERMKEW